MITTTGNEINGYFISDYIGIVRGIVVRSPSITQGMLGGLKQMIGGNIESYAKVCEAAREEAFERMVQHAQERGADAVIGMRYDATEFTQGVTEVLAYGTAVKLTRSYGAAMPDRPTTVWTWAWATLRRAVWAPIAVVAIDFIAGLGFGVYEYFPKFDVPMHLLGGAAVAYFFHTASRLGSRDGILGPYRRTTHVALVFGWVCVTAVFWEFGEYIANRAFDAPVGGNVDDTLYDLALGLVGGAAFLLTAWAMGRLPAAEDSGPNK